jgi:hypothetical protein
MNDATNRPLSTSDLAGTADRAAGATATAPERPVNLARPDDREVAATPSAAPRPQPAPARADDQSAPLFASERAEELRSRWTSIQAGFVDEPKQTVQQADTLVAEVIQDLAKSFADAKSNLEQQWSRGNDASTEDLRLALRRYRSFFDRLLSV